MARALFHLAVLFAGSAILLQLGCAGTAPNIAAGEYLDRPDAAHVRIEEPGFAVFRDRRDWESFWLTHHENRSRYTPEPPTELPYVDFHRNMLVGIFWGAQSGCLSNVEPIQRIGSITMEGGDMVVEVQELGPLGMCRAVSWPVQFIEVPRISGEVVFAGTHPADE